MSYNKGGGNVIRTLLGSPNTAEIDATRDRSANKPLTEEVGHTGPF